MTVPNPLASFAQARPNHPALVTEDTVWSARRWASSVAREAGALAANGIEAGMQVGLRAQSTPSFLRTWQALWWLGAVPVITSQQQTPPCDRELASAGYPAGEPLAPTGWALGDPRVCLLTSGSTATPKTVTLTAAQLLFSAFGSTIRLGHSVSDRWLCCLPLNHIGGLSVLWRASVLQITAVLHRRFDAATVDHCIATGGATMVSLVPDMLRQLLELRDGRPFAPSLRVILVGGERCPEDVLAMARACGAPVALTWGMTETASQLATRLPGDLAPREDAGPALPFVRLSTTSRGTLLVSGPLAPGGVFETADRGVLDDRGRVVLAGRADGVFVSGGENISPSAIEQVLRAHPAVQDAAVVDVPDPRWGRRPVAWVTTGPKEGGAARVAPADVRHFCEGRLERFAIPDRVRVTHPSQIPRTPTGKVDRAEIKRQLTPRSQGAL